MNSLKRNHQYTGKFYKLNRNILKNSLKSASKVAADVLVQEYGRYFVYRVWVGQRTILPLRKCSTGATRPLWSFMKLTYNLRLM
jgi:hypothetical protein